MVLACLSFFLHHCKAGQAVDLTTLSLTSGTSSGQVLVDSSHSFRYADVDEEKLQSCHTRVAVNEDRSARQEDRRGNTATRARLLWTVWIVLEFILGPCLQSQYL